MPFPLRVLHAWGFAIALSQGFGVWMHGLQSAFACLCSPRVTPEGGLMAGALYAGLICGVLCWQHLHMLAAPSHLLLRWECGSMRELWTHGVWVWVCACVVPYHDLAGARE